MNAVFGPWQEMLHLFPVAICAGLVIAVCCSFLGTLVVLKRLVFIGATLSQVAACGIAAAFFYRFNPFWGAVAFNLAAVTILALSSDEIRIPRDAVMAFLFIVASGLSVLFVSKSANGLDEVHSLLYGDLILTSASDFKLLLMILVPLFLLVLAFLRPIVYTFADREESIVLGVKVRLWELVFYYALGIVVSAASKLGGLALVFCYLVVPAIGSLLLCNRLRTALVVSVFLGVLFTLLGFDISYRHDLPTNQVIVAVSCLILAIIYVGKSFFSWLRRTQV